MDMFYYSRIVYARSIAENTGLSLKESDKVKTPCTDGRMILVPKYNYAWEPTSDEAQEWWGKFLHEIYHNDRRYDHPKAMELLKKNKKDLTQMLKYAWNLLEDHRIEYNEWGEFPGRDSSMSILRRNMYKQFKEDLPKGGTGSPKMDALYWLQWAAFGTWLPDLGYVDIRTELPSETQGFVSILDKYIEPIKNMGSAQECWDLAKKIVEELVDDSPKAEKVTVEGRPEEGGDDEGEEEVDYGKYNFHEHDQSDEKKDEGEPARVKAASTGRAHEVPPMEELRPDESKGDYYSHGIISRVHTEGLASQIKRYLLVKVQNRTVNNQKSGRLDTSSLWKASVYRGQPAGSRVFQKNVDHLSLDTAVALLVDQSGSMSGTRIMNAAASAVTLNEVFSKIGIKTRITSFTDDAKVTFNYLHKDYSENISKDKLVKRLSCAATAVMAGNADGENILWEYHKIASRPEAKKLIIVLSDGAPCDSKYGNIYEFTKDVIKGVERSNVGIIGIGIETESVRDFYKRYRILEDSSKIESTLLDILSNEVLHA